MATRYLVLSSAAALLSFIEHTQSITLAPHSVRLVWKDTEGRLVRAVQVCLPTRAAHGMHLHIRIPALTSRRLTRIPRDPWSCYATRWTVPRRGPSSTASTTRRFVAAVRALRAASAYAVTAARSYCTRCRPQLGIACCARTSSLQ
jgi:hypothetical protein